MRIIFRFFVQDVPKFKGCRPLPPSIKILPVNENIDFDEISSRSRRISYLCFLIFIPLGHSLLKILSAKHSIKFNEISRNSTFLFLHFYCSIGEGGGEPPRPRQTKILNATRSHRDLVEFDIFIPSFLLLYWGGTPPRPTAHKDIEFDEISLRSRGIRHFDFFILIPPYGRNPPAARST